MIQQKSLSELRVAKDWYSTKQASELLHVTPTTICNWCRLGWLAADKVGNGRGRWRVYPQQLEDDIESHKEQLIELSRRYWPSLLAKLHKK